jgi:transcriptional regulator with GAF, ATPase, and Fis domain
MNHFNQKLEQLHADEAKIKQQIAQEQHKLQRLKNRKNYYEKGERAKRTHRLITRGAAMESIVPEVKTMSEKEFYALMSAILTRPDIARLIHASTYQNGGD